MNLNVPQSKRSCSQPTPELSSPAGGAGEVTAAKRGAFLLQEDAHKSVVTWQTLGDAVPCHRCEWAVIAAGLSTPGPLYRVGPLGCLTQVEKIAWFR